MFIVASATHAIRAPIRHPPARPPRGRRAGGIGVHERAGASLGGAGSHHAGPGHPGRRKGRTDRSPWPQRTLPGSGSPRGTRARRASPGSRDLRHRRAPDQVDHGLPEGLEVRLRGSGQQHVRQLGCVPPGRRHRSHERAAHRRRRRRDHRQAGPGPRHELRGSTRLGNADGDLPRVRGGRPPGRWRDDSRLSVFLGILEQRTPPAPGRPVSVGPGPLLRATASLPSRPLRRPGTGATIDVGGVKRCRRTVDPRAASRGSSLPPPR